MKAGCDTLWFDRKYYKDRKDHVAFRHDADSKGCLICSDMKAVRPLGGFSKWRPLKNGNGVLLILS